MKRRHHLTFPITVAVACTGAFGLATYAGAQTVNWANNKVNADAFWNTGTNWTGGNVPTSTNIANFANFTDTQRAAGLETPNLNGATVDVAGLVGATRATDGFNGLTYTISGSGTINLGVSGITIQQAQGISENQRFIINPNIALSISQVWSLGGGGGQITASGVVSGGFSLTLNGSNSGDATQTSVLSLGNANTFSGGFTLNTSGNQAGVALGINSALDGSNNVVSGAVGTGTLTLTRGRIQSANTTTRTINNSVVINGDVTIGGLAASGLVSDTRGALVFSTSNGSTFNLSSASNNTLRTLAVESATTVNQAIGETGGGVRQGLVIAGTSTFNLSNQKTFTGDLYGAVGASSILNFNTTTNQAGNAISYGGILQATGTDRFVTGFLGAEGGEVRIEGAANLTGVSSFGLFHNSRISSSTATIAQLASVLDANSNVSYAITAVNSAAFDQSTFGDGKAGLAVGTTSTLAYTGTLSAGSDNAFRVSGGLGTLSLTGSTLIGSGKSAIVQSGGTVNASGNQNYTGATTLNGNLTLSGASGALSGTSGITINNSTLAIDNATNSGSRLNDSAGITLNRGVINVTTAAGNGALSETIGGLTFNAGVSTVSLGTGPTGGNRTYTTASISRANGAVALVRGDSFGVASAGGALTNRNAIIVTATPSGANFVGGYDTADATVVTNRKIIPWAIGGGSATSNGGTFVTYDATTNSLRNLITASEFTLLSGSADTDNIREVRAANATILAASTAKTVNSFILNNTGAGGTVTSTLGSGATLTITSGALQFNQSVGQEIILSGGTIAFGSAPGVVTNTAGSFNTTVSSAITGSAGVSFFATAGQLLVNGTNSFTGGATVGSIGSGVIGISNDNQLGNSANAVTHAGGTLRYFGSSANSSRAITLQGNVGSNTFDVQNASNTTVTLSGKISGDGRLRVTQSGGGSNTLVVSNTGNDYTGGTQVDSGTLRASSDNALGTGSVVVNNATLNFTSATPSIGALYNTTLAGSTGVVNLGNANSSSTALTVGANNDSGIFIGTIAETATSRGSLIKNGTGIQVLTGVNTYTGGTTISGGTLVASFLADTGAVTVNGGTYNVAASDTVGAVTLTSGTINGSGTLTGSSYAVESGTASAALAGTGVALTKSTSGTVTLSGNNTYTGTTTVTVGTLNVTGSLSTGAVSVTGTLTGSGVIGGATTINSTGILNAGGIGGAGKQTFSNSLGFQAGSIFEWDLKTGAEGTAGADFDGVILNTASSSLSVDGNAATGSIFKVVLGENFDGGNAFWSDSSQKSWNVFATTGGATLGANIFSRFQLFDLSSSTVPVNFAQYGSFGFTNSGSTGTLTWTAVPEPTTALAGLLIGAGLLRRRRA